MAVPGPPLSEQDARKYFIDVVLGIEYCKSRSNHSQYINQLNIVKILYNWYVFLFDFSTLSEDCS